MDKKQEDGDCLKLCEDKELCVCVTYECGEGTAAEVHLLGN